MTRMPGVTRMQPWATGATRRWRGKWAGPAPTGPWSQMGGQGAVGHGSAVTGPLNGWLPHPPVPIDDRWWSARSRVSEEQVVSGRELEQDAVHQVLASDVGHNAEYGADLPCGGLLRGAFDPCRGRPDEPLGRQRFMRLERVKQDVRQRFRKQGGQLGAHLAHQVSAQQGQHDPTGSFRLLL